MRRTGRKLTMWLVNTWSLQILKLNKNTKKQKKHGPLVLRGPNMSPNRCSQAPERPRPANLLTIRRGLRLAPELGPLFRAFSEVWRLPRARRALTCRKSSGPHKRQPLWAHGDMANRLFPGLPVKARRRLKHDLMNQLPNRSL